MVSHLKYDIGLRTYYIMQRINIKHGLHLNKDSRDCFWLSTYKQYSIVL